MGEGITVLCFKSWYHNESFVYNDAVKHSDVNRGVKVTVQTCIQVRPDLYLYICNSADASARCFHSYVAAPSGRIAWELLRDVNLSWTHSSFFQSQLSTHAEQWEERRLLGVSAPWMYRHRSAEAAASGPVSKCSNSSSELDLPKLRRSNNVHGLPNFRHASRM